MPKAVMRNTVGEALAPSVFDASAEKLLKQVARLLGIDEINPEDMASPLGVPGAAASAVSRPIRRLLGETAETGLQAATGPSRRGLSALGEVTPSGRPTSSNMPDFSPTPLSPLSSTFNDVPLQDLRRRALPGSTESLAMDSLIKSGGDAGAAVRDLAARTPDELATVDRLEEAIALLQRGSSEGRIVAR